MKTKEKRSRSGGILSAVVVLALLAALGVQVRGLRAQVESARAERDSYQTQVQQLEEKNASLTEDIEEGATQEKLEEIAREELGMVLPGEYVFYSVGG